MQHVNVTCTSVAGSTYDFAPYVNIDNNACFRRVPTSDPVSCTAVQPNPLIRQLCCCGTAADCPLSSRRRRADADNTLTAPRQCYPCHTECSSAGCDGPGPEDCHGCLRARYQGKCVAQCPANTYKDATGVCRECHEQCEGGCSGPLSTDCVTCKNVRDGNTCVASCTATAYEANGQCFACSAQCSSLEPGCTGPSAFDCFACAGVNITATGQCASSCPLNTFTDAQAQCQPCHELCDGCLAEGNRGCVVCRGVTYEGACLNECPAGTYQTAQRTCAVCSIHCKL